MDLDRREFLKLGAALAAAPVMAPAARLLGATQNEGLPSLGDIAAERGLRFGSCIDQAMAALPPEYAALFVHHCRMHAVSYLSWSWVNPVPGIYDFTREQGNMEFSRRHGMSHTGSHLLWYLRTPEWFKIIKDRANAERAVVRHIESMTARFDFWSWNVVNESIEPSDGRDDGLRVDNPLMKVLGPEYLDLAFHTARRCAPKSLLAYNDYGLEPDGAKADKRRSALLKLLDGFAQRGTPIDGVGLQSHLRFESAFDAKRHRAFLRELASRGLKILITELDARDNGAPTDTTLRDQAVADVYTRYLEPTLDETAVVSVVMWGLSDRFSWLSPAYSADRLRPDGEPCRPLPFDEELRPKPAFDAIRRALRAAPMRRMFASR